MLFCSFKTIVGCFGKKGNEMLVDFAGFPFQPPIGKEMGTSEDVPMG